MSIEWELPNLGEGVDEADVAEIVVSEGDTIDPDQVVMELETEKAVLELPCPHGGKIEKILVSSGDTIRVGQKVLVISETSGASADAPQKDDPQASTELNPAEEESAPPANQGAEAASKPAPAASSSGPVDFQLPPLGEGVNSADIAEILVAEGDTIDADQVVMELETEKAVMELPCPHGGKITKIHVSAGDTIDVGQTVLTIATTAGAAPASTPSADQGSSSSPSSQTEKLAKKPAPVEAPKPQTVLQGTPVPTGATSGNNREQEIPVPAAPSTRRLARQLGVDLRQVQGSERGGRITAEDVQAFVRNRMTSNLPARVSGGSAPSSGGALAPPPLPDFSRFGEISRERMNKIGRTAAENLTVSWNVIPHVTQHDRADVTDLEAARKNFVAGIGKNGPKVTQTAIVMKALAKCLQAFPKFNSSLDPETYEIVYKRFYHLGCAVDTPNGLVVPVIRDCDTKSILEIAAELTDLATKARDRKLTPDEMQGATCTVTNLGGIGGVAFTPIVNYPEVCILGMSRGQKELRLNDGKVEERLILPLSLSYDHRVINGADAARFMVTLCNMLADPFQLLTTV